MKRRWNLFLFTFIIFLTGCGYQTKKQNQEVLEQWLQEQTLYLEDVNVANTYKTGKKVGVSMPTKTSQRWINDGMNMKAQLEALGYEVDLQYADDVITMQISQIESMILNSVDCLVIASIDSEALVDVLELAKAEGIAVIAYDRLLMGTEAVSYYATFDNKAVGISIGEYIERKMDLKRARREGKTYTIEFFMGSPDDNNAFMFYDGVMEILTPYLEDGTLLCKSGIISFEETCILRWSQTIAYERSLELLNTYYQDERLDIACSIFDGFAYGIKNALIESGYKLGIDWPLVTGQDAELAAIRDIIQGYQNMTVYKDTRILASKCVTMVEAVLDDGIPEINDTNQYNNGIKDIPSYLCIPIVIDVDNYQEIMVDGGYYTLVQLLD